MSEIKQLRKAARLTQREAAEKLGINVHTFGSYERGDRAPDYKTMDRIRAELAERGGYRDLPDDVLEVMVTDVSSSPEQSLDRAEKLYIDTRFLEGTDVDPRRHHFVRVVGSQMEPILSHRQVIGVEPTGEVAGDDVYVFYSSAHEANSVATVSQRAGGGCRSARRVPARRRPDTTTSRGIRTSTGRAARSRSASLGE